MLTVTVLEDRAVSVLEIGERLTDMDTQTYIAHFSACIQRGTPFGCLFAYTGGTPKKSRAAQQQEDTWLRAHRADLTRLGFGIALVSNPSIVALIQKIVAKGLGARLFGCPMAHFYTREAALVWLATQRERYRAADSTAPRAQEGRL
jgi:hypothetical protein